MSQQVIDFLNARRGASEAVEITAYSVYFGSREVNVLVRDAGEDAGSLRFSVEAEWANVDEENPLDTGHTLSNPDATLDGALWGVHWQNFTPRD